MLDIFLCLFAICYPPLSFPPSYILWLGFHEPVCTCGGQGSLSYVLVCGSQSYCSRCIHMGLKLICSPGASRVWLSLVPTLPPVLGFQGLTAVLGCAMMSRILTQTLVIRRKDFTHGAVYSPSVRHHLRALSVHLIISFTE